MTVKLLVPGRREPAAQYAGSVRGGTPAAPAPATDLLDNVEVVHAFSLAPAARAANAAHPDALELRDDDILEIEVEDGFVLWTSAAGYAARARLHAPQTVSDAGVTLDAVSEPSASERGVKDWVGSALRVLRVKPDAIDQDLHDPQKWPAPIRKLAQGRFDALGVWAAAKLLMHLIESRLRPGPGLYRWPQAIAAAGAEATPLAADDLPARVPLLVFIHGTASTTAGSFGALAEAEAQPHWKALAERFGEHVYAYEHRTLSDSPIDNAIGLLESLPARAQLCLVSHSRGGQVGDLVSLTEITDAQIRAFARRADASRGADMQRADAHDQQQLRRLRALLQEKRIEVLSFARVACPARGTLLASENVDDFLSVLTNLIGLIPGFAGSPLYHVVKRVTLEVVKQRLDPHLIPGIEAMVPDSPLVALLNTTAKAGGRLGVIAGDIEGGHLLKRLALFVSDRFLYEGHDNDLVVNTDSMFHGARREQAWYVYDQGSRVSHFNYFRNEGTRSALVRWLTTAPDQPAPQGFVPLDAERLEPVPTLRAIQKRSGVAQPVVFVLPGIMGSQLERRGNVIWLDYIDLAVGGLGRIRDVDDAQVKAVGLVSAYYRDLCEYLGDTHEVMPFAYDWRRSIRDAGAALAAAVDAALARTSQPVRFVAHSMGGLVVRSFIAQRPDLWNRVRERPGHRLVMLGTPNRGSHSMVETLLGMAAMIRQLALLDVFHSQQQLVDIVARFRGALELLPHLPDGERDWFAVKVWTDLRTLAKTPAAVPAGAFLQEAKRAVSALPVEIPGPESVLYVAGCAPSTPCGIEVDTHGRLLLLTTDQGDGKVTYEAGRLPGVATWYADAAHGDLANHRPAFAGIQQLLADGRTALLSTQPPASARGVVGKVPLLPQPVLYPTEASLTAALMGARPPSRRPRSMAAFKVSVVHGDLRHARFPVMVGHYAGDTISGAESYLDARLNGGLSQRYALGLYPGALGTALVVLHAPNRLQAELGVPRGAVVAGLGSMGELTPGVLANVVRQGVLAYAAQLQERSPEQPTFQTSRTAGLSVLLIGTNSAANVSVESSVSAMLRGVAQACRELESAPRMTVTIGEVEIVELYADVAIQAAHALNIAASEVSTDVDVRIAADPLLRTGQGGQVRILPSLGGDQWRRWIVTASSSTPTASTGLQRLPAPVAQHLRQLLSTAQLEPAVTSALAQLAIGPATASSTPTELTYVALSDRARAEVRVQQSQPELIDKLVILSIRDTQFKLQTARTLFELLIPNELKDALAQQPRLTLVVDAATAAYPWELMAVGSNPICVDAGLVRQLQTAQYRPQIRATTANTAYVVGDPLTSEGVPPLPAAREEAQLVASVLGEQFQVTTTAERPTALEVLDGLFARPYRVVHLAGHGFFASGPGDAAPARSGMLLEGGLTLTAAEVAQMRQIPDLVFLNCCHLGQVGPEARMQPAVEYNRLAASISRELIEMGVRAVVAAGWAVRDDAASYFARTFYDRMLSGAAFGSALLEARRATWRQFPDCNTAGAYQAYGDPDFRLDLGADRAQPGPARRTPRLVAPQELVRALSGSLQVAQIDALLERVSPAWMERAEVLVAAGAAYARAAAFPQATAYYERALHAGDDGEAASLSAVEELANLEARWGERTGDAARIERAIERLENLLKVARTPQRLALLGSAYKRLAQITQAARPLRATLTKASRLYREAAEEQLARGALEPYFAINWLTIDALLDKAPKDASTWLSRARAASREGFAEAPSVWEVFTVPDVELLGALLEGTLRQQGAAEELAALYRAAAEETGATPRELDSAFNQLRFIEQMATRLGERHAADGAAAGKVRGLLEEPPAAPRAAGTRTVRRTRKGGTKRKAASASPRRSRKKA
jgi:CHAT domain-containing protein